MSISDIFNQIGNRVSYALNYPIEWDYILGAFLFCIGVVFISHTLLWILNTVGTIIGLTIRAIKDYREKQQ